MRRFIIRGLCFACIGLALLYVLNLFYIRTNGYKSLDGTYKFYMVPDNINVMNLGSSHGEFGLDYEEINTITGFNFGLRGQSHYFDLQVLKKYSDKLATGCVVVIPVSCFSLLQGVDYDQRILYYRVLGYGSIPDHNPIEYVKFRLLPVLAASFNVKYLISDKKSIDPDLFATPGADEEFYIYNALYYYGLFEDLKKEGANNENNVKTLGEIVEYCQDNGFKPVLITTPFTNHYNYWYSTEDYSEFYAAIDSIVEKYGVPYLDYSHDPRFGGTLEWFGDSDHLNPTGRRIFTTILLSDLGII
jgi:DltD protein